MKRIAGLLTALAMLASMCALPVYAFEDDEWIFEYADGCEKSEDIYGNVSKDGAVSGRYGLYLYNNLTDMPVTAKSSEISFKGGTEYTLTMWTGAERVYDVGGFKIGIDNVMADKNVVRMTTVSESGGHKKLSVSFTPEDDITSRISLKLNSKYKSGNRAAYALVDDIAITDGAEEIYTCGFENIETGGDRFAAERFSADRYPTNVTAVGWYGAIGLSWVNPTASGIEKIVVLDDATGEVIADSDSDEIKKGFDFEPAEIAVGSGEVNTLWVYDCAIGETRTFRLKFIYSGDAFNNFTEYKVSGTATESADGAVLGVSGFQLSIGGIQKDYRFSTVTTGVDGDTVYSGDKSLKISINASGNDDSFIEFMTDSSVRFEKGKTYRVSMRIKGENVTSVNYMSNWDAVPGVNAAFVGTYDWKELTYDITPSSNYSDAALRWRFYGKIGALWLDDITAYELDENLEPTGGNLVTYGDFESGYKSPSTADVSDASAVSAETGVRLEWSLPEKEIKNVKIYEITENGRTAVATLDGGISETVIKDAALDAEHTYLITTVNPTGFESEGVECGVYHERRGIVCGDITLERNGLYVSDISEAGEYTVLLTFATDDVTEKDAELFVMYTDGGLLKRSDFRPGAVNAGSMKTVSCTVNIDEPTDTDVLKVFFWDSIEEMNTIKSAAQFE